MIRDGDIVEVVFNSDLFEKYGRPLGLDSNFGISYTEYENKTFTVVQSRDFYNIILKEDRLVYSWPIWLLKKVGSAEPIWEI